MLYLDGIGWQIAFKVWVVEAERLHLRYEHSLYHYKLHRNSLWTAFVKITENTKYTSISMKCSNLTITCCGCFTCVSLKVAINKSYTTLKMSILTILLYKDGFKTDEWYFKPPTPVFFQEQMTSSLMWTQNIIH